MIVVLNLGRMSRLVGNYIRGTKRNSNLTINSNCHVKENLLTDINIVKGSIKLSTKDISRGVDSNETNPAGTGDFIMSRSCDKLKTYLHQRSTYDHQTW